MEGLPDYFLTDPKIFMRQDISHVPHILPRDFGMIRNKVFGQMSRSLPDNLEVAHNGITVLVSDLKVSISRFLVYSAIRSMEARMSLILRSHFLCGINSFFQNVIP